MDILEHSLSDVWNQVPDIFTRQILLYFIGLRITLKNHIGSQKNKFTIA